MNRMGPIGLFCVVNRKITLPLEITAPHFNVPVKVEQKVATTVMLFKIASNVTKYFGHLFKKNKPIWSH